ncbi:MAG: hypothetical protein COA88_00610 [Kordia sp.]|nr:MAG: hypothetical protein COA88_00610 [Kordia sp.]
MDDNIWPKYNEWLYDFIKAKLEIVENKNIDITLKKTLLKAFGECLNNKGVYYNNIGNYSMALKYYEESLLIMKEAGYKKEIAVTLNNIGYIHLTTGESLKALEYYLKSIKIKKGIGDKKGIANSQNNIAQVYYDHGDIAKALAYNLKSLKIKEKLNDDRGISASLNNIAVIYIDQGENKKALEFYLKSLALNVAIEDKRMTAIILNNIGLLYTTEGNYSNALEYYERSLNISSEVTDKHGLLYSLRNIGDVYKAKGSYPEALEYYQKSLKISEEIKNKKEIATSLNSVSNIYLIQNNVMKAKSYANKSMRLAKELGYPLRIRDASEVLKKVYQNEGNWKEAFMMQQLFIEMRDSVRNEKTEQNTIKQQAKYDLEKKELQLSKSEQEVKLLSSQNEVQELRLYRNRISIIMIATALGLVVILIILVLKGNKKKKVIFKLLKKQKEDISRKNAEKTIMLKEIHHRVKNNLQVVNSLLRYQSRGIEDKKILGMFETAQKRVLSMAMLHEKLYRSEDLKHIDVKDHITLLIEDLVKNYAVGKKIKLDIDISRIPIKIAVLTPLGLIISELITNSLKYAFVGQKNGQISVSLKEIQNKKYELIVTDDGVGFMPSEKPKGLGSKLVQIFTKQLKGVIEKSDFPGTVYKIVF